MIDTTIVCLTNLDCAVFDTDKHLPCPHDASFLLIEKDGAHTAVCLEHIATDADGAFLPDITLDARADESADAERAQTDAEHHADLIAEREMVAAQTPVVNVQEEAE